jgi:transcriptional regulator with XRE-family HTH domain
MIQPSKLSHRSLFTGVALASLAPLASEQSRYHTAGGKGVTQGEYHLRQYPRATWRAAMKAIIDDRGASKPAVGPMPRAWRMRRHLSQLALAVEAEISQRHLSFIESGRAQPSREMLIRVAEQLQVPLRDRNTLLYAAGFAPMYRERALDDPDLAAARLVIDRVLKAHEPNPALVVDRHWNLVAANAAVTPLLAPVSDPALVAPPVNVLRLTLHPAGLGPVIVNLPSWRFHVIARLKHQFETTADPRLGELVTELSDYPATNAFTSASNPEPEIFSESGSIAVPMRIRMGEATLSFISTTTVFGTPLDITLSELALETFFPEDDATAAALAQLATR